MGRSQDDDNLEQLPPPTGNGQSEPPDPGADDRSTTESGGNGQGD